MEFLQAQNGLNTLQSSGVGPIPEELSRARYRDHAHIELMLRSQYSLGYSPNKHASMGQGSQAQGWTST